ncbi:Glu/Leu/Phe/Val dehydrogenase dimerization domain-containing protein [Polluticoccus soli]|uniref:Glu/Leu/Phe/Val dehydrogenase dimerization domain-containing protein n=1 Tax=Polluticoccus soli TaxID=3034150 RepID=UPI0023E24F6A|nr:Glu/Leu/Phe/Val dehydrogenase dimerization domain-containing protein [Flavipsychrobacter sp. JY13-12]
MQQSVFDLMQQMGHEQLVFCHDPYSGLNAIIAIHNTTLGPALGGTRLWNYNSHEEGVIDALRLSRGMTYKAAISDLNLGGGKAVIIGDANKIKSEGLWRRYGKFVDSLNGKYITAEDVNTSARDMEYISLETEHVTGVPEYMGGSGDPSPFTAYGVFVGMKASAKKVWGNDSLAGKKVLVQGVGHVGQYLVGHLIEAGAKVMISDINETRIKETTDKFKVEVINNSDIFAKEFDVYAPCALGATVNTESISKMKCPIIAGAANNQLAEERVHGPMLIEKGILYAPDFLINAGGLINVSAELDGYNHERVMGNVEKIYNRTLEIFNLSEKENVHTQAAAMMLAEKRLADIANVKSRL